MYGQQQCATGGGGAAYGVGGGAGAYGTGPYGGGAYGAGAGAGAYGTGPYGGGANGAGAGGVGVVGPSGGGGAAVGSGAGAGANVGCATATCMAGGCAVATGASSMSFVGPGNGDYITETTYRYVGQGAGNLKVITPTTILAGRILGLILTLLAIALLIAFWPSSSTTTKNESSGLVDPPTGEIGECTFWGDPHLISFDKGRPSFYGDGEYWIVHAGSIKIQGRYMGTKYTKGLAATNKIIVGGGFINHHTIAVGTMDSGELLVDGRPVLSSFPSQFSVPGGFGEISYDSSGELVDQATKIWPKKVVTMRLPNEVTITVFRWANYLDLRIQMPQVPGMDGSCGNFNGDPADDSTEAVFNRIGARIPRGQNMFNRRADVDWTEDEDKILKLCAADKKAAAQSHCNADLGAGASEFQINSCMLDHCFGANEHVLKMAEELGL